MVNFAMVKVDSFGKDKLIAVYIKVFDGKDTRIVVFKQKRWTNLSIWMFKDIVKLMSKEVLYLTLWNYSQI